MRSLHLLGSAVAILWVLAFGPYGEFEPKGLSVDNKSAGLLVLMSEDEAAQLFVNARFMGTVGPDRKMELRLPAGRQSLRVSTPGNPDLFGAVQVEPNKRVTLSCKHADPESPYDPPLEAQPVGWGQTIRLTLVHDEEVRQFWRFKLEGKAGDRTLLSIAQGPVDVETQVIVEESKEDILVRVLEPGRETGGLDGRQFREFVHPVDGNVILTVSSKSKAARKNLVLRVHRAPGGLIQDGAKSGRRQPPVELRQK